jgi:hypothetical protein
MCDFRVPWRSGTVVGMDTPPDHDLPLLAMRLAPRPRPDWESLLDDGVQPALMLGAERRFRGARAERAAPR